MAQWLQTFGDPRGTDDVRLIDWIELIPFAETRNYVQRVLENRVVYRLVLGSPGATRIQAIPGDGQREAERQPAAERS